MRQRTRGRGPRKRRRARRQRVFDALGYVAFVLLIALIAHKHLSQAPRGPEPQVATSVPITGTFIHPVADR